MHVARHLEVDRVARQQRLDVLAQRAAVGAAVAAVHGAMARQDDPRRLRAVHRSESGFKPQVLLRTRRVVALGGVQRHLRAHGNVQDGPLPLRKVEVGVAAEPARVPEAVDERGAVAAGEVVVAIGGEHGHVVEERLLLPEVHIPKKLEVQLRRVKRAVRDVAEVPEGVEAFRGRLVVCVHLRGDLPPHELDRAHVAAERDEQRPVGIGGVRRSEGDVRRPQRRVRGLFRGGPDSVSAAGCASRHRHEAAVQRPVPGQYGDGRVRVGLDVVASFVARTLDTDAAGGGGSRGHPHDRDVRDRGVVSVRKSQVDLLRGRGQRAEHVGSRRCDRFLAGFGIGFAEEVAAGQQRIHLGAVVIHDRVEVLARSLPREATNGLVEHSGLVTKARWQAVSVFAAADCRDGHAGVDDIIGCDRPRGDHDCCCACQKHGDTHTVRFDQ
mmetsp:Transcript_8968/g.27836  ORF Transcript_8968/g.27836 Transcript_8968/m.27836 type:complete len:439 (+) Transcript_8968:379-1695(+)